MQNCECNLFSITLRWWLTFSDSFPPNLLALNMCIFWCKSIIFLNNDVHSGFASNFISFDLAWPQIGIFINVADCIWESCKERKQKLSANSAHIVVFILYLNQPWWFWNCSFLDQLEFYCAMLVKQSVRGWWFIYKLTLGKKPWLNATFQAQTFHSPLFLVFCGVVVKAIIHTAHSSAQTEVHCNCS